MKFIVDAQLPVKLKTILIEKGQDVIHTNDLPDKDRTTDTQIRAIALQQERIVISKDTDFIDSFYVKGSPEKLLIIATGNIKNKELFELFNKNIDKILMLFLHNNLLEMDNEELIVHE